MKHIYILPVPMVGYNLAGLEDIMDGIIYYAMTGKRDIFDSEVDSYCDTIPDSDVAAFEEKEYRELANKALHHFTPMIKNSLGLVKFYEVSKLLEKYPISQVDIVNRTELVFEIDESP